MLGGMWRHWTRLHGRQDARWCSRRREPRGAEVPRSVERSVAVGPGGSTAGSGPWTFKRRGSERWCHSHVQGGMMRSSQTVDG